MCPTVADFCGILTLQSSDQDDGRMLGEGDKGREHRGQMEKDISGVGNIITK